MNEFTYKEYEELLGALKDTSKIDLAQDYKQGDVFIRHDVDLSLKKAVELGELEAKKDVQSTFFLSPSFPFYNLTNEIENVEHLQMLGHDIGLHANPKTYLLEYKLLKEFHPVKTISWHFPPDEKLRGPLKVKPNLLNMYSKKLMKNYYSDSRGIWNKDYKEITKPAKGVKQLLVHPEWWNETALTPPKSLECVYTDIVNQLDINLAKTITDVRRAGYGSSINTNLTSTSFRRKLNKNSDYENWLFGILNIETNMAVLDIGTGDGEITQEIAKRTCPRVVEGIDISKDATDNLNSLGTNILAHNKDMDEAFLGIGYYDVIFSSYSLYYTKEPKKLIEKIYTALKPNGVLFFTGPETDNNKEINNLFNLNEFNPYTFYMNDVLPRLVKSKFGNLNKFYKQHELTMNKEELTRYIENSNYSQYKPPVELPENFKLTKKVLGLYAKKEVV